MRDLQRVIRFLRPGDRLSHATAALWLGVPVPRGIASAIHITSGPGLSQVRAAGIVGHRDDGKGCAVVRGVAVSSPEQLFLELALELGFEDLVAVGDYLIHAPRFPEPGRPFTTTAGLAAAAERGHRWGAPNARRALLFVRPGVESPQETKLRLLLVQAGLPEPVCGYELRSARGRIGWFDLAWPEFRVLGEYDGDQHRTDAAQYDRDIRRFDLAADEDWRVVRVRSRGLGEERAETVRRFRRVLRHAA